MKLAGELMQRGLVYMMWRVWYQRVVQRAKNPLPRKAALLAVACQRNCARQQTPYDAHRLAHAWGMAG